MKPLSLKLIFLSLSLFFAGLISCTISAPDFGGGHPPTKIGSTAPATPAPPINEATANMPSTRASFYPFDLLIDTVAYMSCPSKDFISPHFYFASFKEGLILSEEFEERFNRRDYSNQLKESPFLKTAAQVSLSQDGNITNVFNPGSTATANDPCGFVGQFPFFDTRDSDFFRDLERRNPVTQIGVQNLVTPFPSASNHLNQIIPLLKSNYNFSHTYASNNCSPIARQDNSYYGRYYKMDFSGGPDDFNYLTRIKEYKHGQTRLNKNWDCNVLRIPILRHANISKYLYNNYKEYFNKNNLSPEVQCRPNSRILKSSLRNLVEDILIRNFDIGEIYEYDRTEDPSDPFKRTKKPCVVPKQTNAQCYGGQAVRISLEKDCNNFDSNNVCPAYLSVCTRD